MRIAEKVVNGKLKKLNIYIVVVELKNIKRKKWGIMSERDNKKKKPSMNKEERKVRNFQMKIQNVSHLEF
jgi:hypothetical protein